MEPFIEKGLHHQPQLRQRCDCGRLRFHIEARRLQPRQIAENLKIGYAIPHRDETL
jgi:hypothetical protein